MADYGGFPGSNHWSQTGITSRSQREAGAQIFAMSAAELRALIERAGGPDGLRDWQRAEVCGAKNLPPDLQVAFATGKSWPQALQQRPDLCVEAQMLLATRGGRQTCYCLATEANTVPAVLEVLGRNPNRTVRETVVTDHTEARRDLALQILDAEQDAYTAAKMAQALGVSLAAKWPTLPLAALGAMTAVDCFDLGVSVGYRCEIGGNPATRTDVRDAEWAGILRENIILVPA